MEIVWLPKADNKVCVPCTVIYHPVINASPGYKVWKLVVVL